MDAPDLPSENGSIHSVTFHPAIRWAARVLSVIFHPLFIPVYIAFFLIYSSPVFPAFKASEKSMLLIRFAVLYTVFPLVTVLLSRALGFVESIYLRTQKDRIIPYVACGVYYFWMWYVLRNQQQVPRLLVMLALAVFLASSLGLILNSFIKISMHAMALGVMVAFLLVLAFRTDINFGFYIALALLITGLVSTARLINSDHHPAEVYLGLFVGVLAELIAAYFV
jgi:hypothetical protein